MSNSYKEYASKEELPGVMTGATDSAAGTSGLVPAPAKGDQNKFLQADGTWKTPTDTTYNVATESADGLMSAADKVKVATIDDLAQMNFPTGIKYIGRIQYADQTDDYNIDTFFNNVTESGLYLFLTNVFAMRENSTTTLMLTPYILHYIKFKEEYKTSEWASQNWTEYYLINAIQIAEPLYIDNAKGYTYYRYYQNNGSDDDDFTWTEWKIDANNSGTITCDTDLSLSSSNPVANSVITTALNKKLATSGGTLTGTLKAQSNTDYTTYQVRNIALSITASTPTGNGSLLGVII